MTPMPDELSKLMVDEITYDIGCSIGIQIIADDEWSQFQFEVIDAIAQQLNAESQ